MPLSGGLRVEYPDAREPVALRFSMNDAELDILRRFSSAARAMLAALDRAGGLPASIHFSFAQGEGLQFKSEDPTEDQRAAILHFCRPSLLTNEPGSFDKACGAVRRTSDHRFLGQQLRRLRDTYSGKDLRDAVVISRGDLALTSETSIQHWLKLWTMKILAVRQVEDVRGAVVRGWIQELAWYRPGQAPGYGLLLSREGRLYHVPEPDSAGAFLALTQALEPGAAPPKGSQLVIDSPLTVGDVYGQIESRGDRSDTFYAWYVESQVAIHPPARWSIVNSMVQQWRLTYRTAPDHTVLDFVPGVGITHYTYSHHGTIAEADVKLVGVRQAP